MRAEGGVSKSPTSLMKNNLLTGRGENKELAASPATPPCLPSSPSLGHEEDQRDQRP